MTGENQNDNSQENVSGQGVHRSIPAMLPRLAAVLAALLGLFALAGWAFDVHLLKSVLPGAVEMKVNTAVGLVLSGCVLFILESRPSSALQRVAQTLALAVAALGLATLGQYVFGWQLGIDELLFRDTPGRYNLIPGRMAPFTAAGFAILGLGLAALSRSGLWWLAWLAGIAATVAGVLPVIGYLWNASEFVTDRWLPPVAVNTAIAFVLLGAGMLLATRSQFTQQEGRPIRSRTGVEKRILGGFVAALLLLLFAGGLTYRGSADSADSARWVSHTQEVRAALRILYGNVSDGESAQRNYLITNQREHLDEYARLTAKIKDHEEALARLVADNPDQLRNLAELKLLIDRAFNLLDRGISLNKQQGFAAARELVASGPAIRIIKDILTLTDRMDAKEEKLLLEREKTLARASQRTLASLLFTLAVAVSIFGLLYRSIRRELAKRKRAEETLQENEERFRVMADNISQLAWMADEKGFIFWYNKRWFDYTGTSLKEMEGWGWQKVHHPDHVARVVEKIRRCFQTGEVWDDTFPLRGSDGNYRWFLSRAVPIRDEQGKVLRWFGTNTDVTERKRAEEALLLAKQEAESANRAKSTFLATMSHEIRTPMNGVLGMIEILSLSKLDAEQRTTIEIVRESGKSLLRIIDDILDFSKIEAGKLEVHPEVASIQEIIESVRNLFTGSASSKGLFLNHSSDPQISSAVLVDPVRLRQILSNFASNALKFTPQGGTIEIKAELIERADGKDRVRFSVKDNGPGISAEQQERLFQPFIQAESDTTRRYGGTGLGLTICRRLADMMGGTIKMVSELGKGTNMMLTLSLPIADPKELPAKDRESTRDLLSSTMRMRRMAPSVAQAETEGNLVLLADDHPTNRLLLMRQLNLLGYAVESAENGVEALDQWKSGRFGIVVTDCHMPKMDGYELTRSIRGLESAKGGKRIPIIACTANALEGEAEICFAAGMDDYLAKPIELKELLKKLDQWLPIPAVGTTPAETSGKGSDAPAPGADAAAPVDRSVLAEISSSDAAAERDILLDFRRVNDEDSAMLKRAVAENNMPQVTRASHRIKGASRMVGAVGLAGVCERIEHASRANDLPAVEAGMGAFHREWMRLNAYLDSL